MGFNFRVSAMEILTTEFLKISFIGRNPAAAILTAIINFYSNDHYSYLLCSKLNFTSLYPLFYFKETLKTFSALYEKRIAFLRLQIAGLYLGGFDQTIYIRR